MWLLTRRPALALRDVTHRALSSRHGPSERFWRPVTPREALGLLSRLIEHKGPSSAAAAPPPPLDPDLRECLRRLAAHKQSDVAWRLYAKLGAAGVGLDSEGFTGFVKAVGSVGKKGLAERAKRIEEDLRTAGAHDPLDEEQVCALIQASANSGCFDDAERTFEEASRAAAVQGRSLTDKVTQFYILACSRVGKAERALELFEEHFGERLGQADSRAGPAFVAVMNAFGRRGDVERVESAPPQWVKRRANLPTACWALAVGVGSHLCRAHRPHTVGTPAIGDRAGPKRVARRVARTHTAAKIAPLQAAGAAQHKPASPVGRVPLSTQACSGAQRCAGCRTGWRCSTRSCSPAAKRATLWRR